MMIVTRVTSLGRVRTRVLAVLGLLCVSVTLCRGTPPPPSARQDSIAKLKEALVLDGKMGDSGWKWATTYSDFKTVHPEAGKSPSERTEVFLAYDAATLYVAIRNHPLLLGLILERVTGKSVTAYLQEKLWSPLGMEYAGSWSVNGDKDGLEKMESGINARTIDFAKYGRLMLNNGQWEGKQVVSETWVEEATQPEEKLSSYYEDDPFFVSLGHYYKYFWWGGKRPGGKSDFCAVGNKGQYIYVSPQKKMIIVRNGFDFGIPTSRWLRLFYQLVDSL